MGGSSVGDFGNTKGSVLDSISAALSAAALIPGADTAVDFVSIPVDLLRGDFISAGLDVLGIIPLAGEVADAAKLARIADNAVDAAKSVKKATTVKKATKTISPSKLTQTHKLTLSRKQYSKLVENIKTNGIKDPIKYVEHNGNKYVVDGHHRLQAAKQLKFKEIPVQKVSLPYKGYRTIDDLFWFD